MNRHSQRGWWNIVIPAIASIAGGLLSRSGQSDANEQNAEIAREQMRFQERMSNTAYQRGVKDMAAAGLNPMLAYQQGGASAPTGATATMQNENAQLGAAITSSASQAMQVAQAYEQAQAISAQTQYTKAQTAQTIAQTLSPELYQAQGYSNLYATHEATRLANRQGDRTDEEIKRTEQETRKLIEEIVGVRARSGSEQEMFEEMKKRGGFAADVERRKAESAISGYGVSEAKSVSEFFNNAGQMPKWAQLLIQILRATK